MEQDSKEKPSQFRKISKSFFENMNSLVIFVKRSGEFAQQHDIETFQELKSMRERVGQILEPENFEKVEEPEIIEDTPENRANPPDSVITKRFLIKDPKRVDELFDLLNAIPRLSPRQAYLLNRGALVMAVSYFEVLLAQLIEAFYSEHPAALSDSSTLKFAELKDLDSISEAIALVVQKEAETVMFKNTNDQLDYFKNHLKISLDSIKDRLPNLFEIVLRRNLVVHNDSVVNKRYTNGVANQYQIDNNIVEGKKIPIRKDYILESIDSISFIGLTLIQLCWRKWHKDETDLADFHLQDQLYEILKDERYPLTSEQV